MGGCRFLSRGSRSLALPDTQYVLIGNETEEIVIRLFVTSLAGLAV
jgi:hypothetical protein